MFTSITESPEFQAKYKKYMEVQEDQIYTNLVESIEVTGNDIYRTLTILEDCVKLMDVDETALQEDSSTADMLKKIQPFLDSPEKFMDGYKAVSTEIATVKSWNEEKGIINKIIAFIKGIVRWLWSIIKTVFSGLKNFFVRLLGGKPIKDTKEKIISLSDALSTVKKSQLDTVELVNKDNKKNTKYQLYKIMDPSVIQGLSESYDFLSEAKETADSDEHEAEVIGKKADDKGENKGNKKYNNNYLKDDNYRKSNTTYASRVQHSPSMVVFDLKNEMYSLKQLVDHFLSIFDTAYGSNNENLFGVDDLELILQLFVSTLNDLKMGKVKSYETRAGYVEIKPIDANSVRDNLIKTNANLTRLKDVFAQTHNGIQSVGRLLNAKQMQALAASPQIYKFLSMETYGEMKGILDVLDPRIKEAKSMEKALELNRKRFEAVAAELDRLTPALSALGNLTYLPEHQKRVLNLLNASKYMTQTVQLRLSAVTLYLRDLEEIKALMVALSAGGKQFATEFALKY